MVLLLSRKMVRTHKEGKNFLTVLLIVLIIINASVFVSNQSLLFFTSLVSFFIFLFFLQFFRHPKIKKTIEESKVVSPANGKVVFIGEVEETEYFKEKKLQISIFMSPFDVHINRYPISGTIQYYKYHKGKYLVAWHPKSSNKNERTTTVIENKNIKLLVRQIAGLVARRIINYSIVGSEVDQASQLGFIKFGSRADIFLPLNFKPIIKVGDKTTGGVTILGSSN